MSSPLSLQYIFFLCSIHSALIWIFLSNNRPGPPPDVRGCKVDATECGVGSNSPIVRLLSHSLTATSRADTYLVPATHWASTALSPLAILEHSGFGLVTRLTPGWSTTHLPAPNNGLERLCPTCGVQRAAFRWLHPGPAKGYRMGAPSAGVTLSFLPLFVPYCTSFPWET